MAITETIKDRVRELTLKTGNGDTFSLAGATGADVQSFAAAFTEGQSITCFVTDNDSAWECFDATFTGGAVVRTAQTASSTGSKIVWAAGEKEIVATPTAAFWSRLISEIALKAPIASPVFTGNVTVNGDIRFGTNNAFDIGTTSSRARNGWFGGTVVANDLSVVTTGSFGGNVTVQHNSDPKVSVKNALGNVEVVLQYVPAVSRARVGTVSSQPLSFMTGGGDWWQLTTLGNLVPFFNNYSDVGSSSLRPKTVYGVAGDFSGNLTASGTGTFKNNAVLLSDIFGSPGIWLGTTAVASPGTSNFAMVRVPGQATAINALSGEELHFRIANFNMGVISATGASFGGNVSATNNIQAEGMLISGLGTYGSLTPGFVATASSTMTLRTVSGTAANLVVGGSGEFSGCNIYSGTGYGIFDSGAPNANGLILRINGNTNVLSTQPVVSSGTIYVNNLTASGTVTLGPFTFGTLPSAAANAGAIVRITDRGQRIAYSDGTNWRFVSDDSIVS